MGFPDSGETSDAPFPVTSPEMRSVSDGQDESGAKLSANSTWHFGISSSHHLRPLLNREILNVDRATPAVSLNRSRPNLVQI